MAMNSEDWLTVNEAAEQSGYNAEYIRELIRQGKIKARKFSIVWMVSNESLAGYLKKVQTLGEKRGRKAEN
jgi:excisionase family DNA binding protein